MTSSTTSKGDDRERAQWFTWVGVFLVSSLAAVTHVVVVGVIVCSPWAVWVALRRDGVAAAGAIVLLLLFSQVAGAAATFATGAFVLYRYHSVARWVFVMAMTIAVLDFIADFGMVVFVGAASLWRRWKE